MVEASVLRQRLAAEEAQAQGGVAVRLEHPQLLGLAQRLRVALLAEHLGELDGGECGSRRAANRGTAAVSASQPTRVIA